MSQGETHPNQKTVSAYEYEEGKYARPVVLVPGLPSPNVAGVEVQGTSTAGSTSKQGNPVRLGAKYKATAETRADGETADLVTDSAENLKITLGAALLRTLDSITTFQASCEITTVDLATDADVVVTASPAVLLGVFVDTVMSAHAALVKDSTTTKVTVPASSAAGYQIPGYSATFATNITVESDNSATGKLLIFWRAA